MTALFSLAVPALAEPRPEAIPDVSVIVPDVSVDGPDVSAGDNVTATLSDQLIISGTDPAGTASTYKKSA